MGYQLGQLKILITTNEMHVKKQTGWQREIKECERGLNEERVYGK
jgi:hypothetical protein